MHANLCKLQKFYLMFGLRASATLFTGAECKEAACGSTICSRFDGPWVYLFQVRLICSKILRRIFKLTLLLFFLLNTRIT